MRLVRLVSVLILVLALVPATLPPTPRAADMPCCAGDQAPCSRGSWQQPLMDCCRPQPAAPAAPAPRAAQPEVSARPLAVSSTAQPPAPPALPSILERPAPAGGILSRSLLSRNAVLLI